MSFENRICRNLEVANANRQESGQPDGTERVRATDQALAAAD
jgi:hypothetical protein